MLPRLIFPISELSLGVRWVKNLLFGGLGQSLSSWKKSHQKEMERVGVIQGMRPPMSDRIQLLQILVQRKPELLARLKKSGYPLIVETETCRAVFHSPESLDQLLEERWSEILEGGWPFFIDMKGQPDGL